MAHINGNVPHGWAGVPMEESDVQAVLAATGGVLRRLRQDQRLLLADLAERWGVSDSVLCRLELARRGVTLRQITMLSGLLGVRPSDILRAAEDEAFPVGFSPWAEDRSLDTPEGSTWRLATNTADAADA